MLDKMDLRTPARTLKYGKRSWETSGRHDAAIWRARPDKPTADTFTAWLENELDRSAAAKADFGSPGIHRLNRSQYANVIRDLLALEVDVSSLLPPDDSSFGFDNMASSLSVSSALLEAYLAAASKSAGSL